MSLPAWSTGPAEVLLHGEALLQWDDDVNRRLALISIDNSVELMMKIYLGLPKRITGLAITRREFQEFSDSFPRLLDAMELHASAKIEGIDLGEIEWYHRLRNELYHSGNGLTVERQKVDDYRQLARQLFLQLFGVELPMGAAARKDLLDDFMNAWRALEQRIIAAVSRFIPVEVGVPRQPLRLVPDLAVAGVLSPSDVEEFANLKALREAVVTGGAIEAVTIHAVAQVDRLSEKLRVRLNTKLS